MMLSGPTSQEDSPGLLSTIQALYGRAFQLLLLVTTFTMRFAARQLQAWHLLPWLPYIVHEWVCDHVLAPSSDSTAFLQPGNGMSSSDEDLHPGPPVTPTGKLAAQERALTHGSPPTPPRVDTGNLRSNVDAVTHPVHRWYITPEDLDYFLRHATRAPTPTSKSNAIFSPASAAEWGSPLMHIDRPNQMLYTSWRRNRPHADASTVTSRGAGSAAAGASKQSAGSGSGGGGGQLTEYLSVTIVPDCSAREYMDFSLDDEGRMQWEGFLKQAQVLEEGDYGDRQEVVRWVRSFPFSFITDREYIIARRCFTLTHQLGALGQPSATATSASPYNITAGSAHVPADADADTLTPVSSTLYCATKSITHPGADHSGRLVTVTDFHSLWSCRDIPDPWVTGRRACEVVLLHSEDLHVPERLARMAVRMGMSSFVNSMTAAVPGFVADRRTRASPDAEDPLAFGSPLRKAGHAGSVAVHTASGNGTQAAAAAAAAAAGRMSSWHVHVLPHVQLSSALEDAAAEGHGHHAGNGHTSGHREVGHTRIRTAGDMGLIVEEVGDAKMVPGSSSQLTDRRHVAGAKDGTTDSRASGVLTKRQKLLRLALAAGSGVLAVSVMQKQNGAVQASGRSKRTSNQPNQAVSDAEVHSEGNNRVLGNGGGILHSVPAAGPFSHGLEEFGKFGAELMHRLQPRLPAMN